MARSSSDSVGLGDDGTVFDRTGSNASGGLVLDTPTFYLVSVISVALGYGAMAITAYLARNWDPKPPLYIAAVLIVLVSMIGGSHYAIDSQRWLPSLAAYLVLVAGAFGALFGPFVRAVGVDTLVPAAGITIALMVVLCMIGLAIKADLFNSWFSDFLNFSLLAYLFFSLVTAKAAAHNTHLLLIVAYIGIGLFALITVRDMNRAKYIAVKDVDNAVDVGLQMWLNSINILLRIMQALSANRSS